MVGGNLNTFEIENLMDIEMETHHHRPTCLHVVPRLRTASGFRYRRGGYGGGGTMMGSVGQPPAVLSKMIGGALVGTFWVFSFSTASSPGGWAARSRRSRRAADLSVHEGCAAGQHEWLRPPGCRQFGHKGSLCCRSPGLCRSWKKPSKARSDECPITRPEVARPAGLVGCCHGDDTQQPIVVKKIKKGGGGGARRRLEDRLC